MRIILMKIIKSWIFEAVIILLIIASTVILAFEHPLEDPNSDKINILRKLDIVISALFCLEAVLKIIVSGFIANGPHSYLMDQWNVLDFLIVISSLASFFVSNVSISIIKIFRMARILRPLRLVQHSSHLKIAVYALFKSIPSIIRLQLVVFFVMFMISLLMTSLLSG